MTRTRPTFWENIDFREIESTLLKYLLFKSLYDFIRGCFSFPATRAASSSLSESMKFTLVFTILIDLFLAVSGIVVGAVLIFMTFFILIYLVIKQLRYKKISQSDIEHLID